MRRCEGLSTTECRGTRRLGLLFGPTASCEAHGRPFSAPCSYVPTKGWEGATMCDTQADVPSARRLWAQLAFKDSMVHGILQFTPSIAFRYVLHRCESRDIRCRESFWLSKGEDAPRPHTISGVTGALSIANLYSLAHSAPGFVYTADVRSKAPHGA